MYVIGDVVRPSVEPVEGCRCGCAENWLIVSVKENYYEALGSKTGQRKAFLKFAVDGTFRLVERGLKGKPKTGFGEFICRIEK